MFGLEFLICSPSDLVRFLYWVVFFACGGRFGPWYFCVIFVVCISIDITTLKTQKCVRQTCALPVIWIICDYILISMRAREIHRQGTFLDAR